MTTSNGGPAFPQNTKIMLPAGQEIHQGFMGGMTLRDYFAAKAMQAAITRNGFYDDEPQLSRWCYETADAMLKAREM